MLFKIITILLIVLTPAIAFADPAVDKPYEQGLESFLKGEFTNAIFHFKDAHTADLKNGGKNDAVIPLNLSVCYEKIGNLSEALKYAEEAHSVGLGADSVDTNLGRIAVFRRILKAQSTAGKIERVNKNETLCAADDQCEAGLVCGSNGACVVDTNIEYEESRMSALGYVGTGFIVASLGLFAYSIFVFDTEVGDLEKQLQNTKLSATEIQDLEKQQSDTRSNGLIVLFAGAGTAAVGVGLLIYDLATVEKSPVALVPVITPNRVGANFSFNF